MENTLLSRALVTALALASLRGALAQETAPAAPAPKRPQHVFIVSFDGGKPAVMLKSKMPRFFSTALQGSWTWQARTIFPSITLPSHTSMLTGVVMEKHGISWNDYQPDRGTVKVPTVFQLAKARGYKTGLFAGKEKFKHLNVAGTVDKFDVPAYESQKVAASAAAYIKAEKPNLCFIHFADSDGAGHKYGWGTPEQVKAFEDEDEALDTVMDAVEEAGIADDSVVILSADHGGHDKTHGTNSDEDRNIPWVAWGKGVRSGWNLQRPISTCDTAATALWLLNVPVPADWDGKPVTEAFEQ
jgi:predicted AlkP superfamily pyrophosphatase or phosphodiesterase